MALDVCVKQPASPRRTSRRRCAARRCGRSAAPRPGSADRPRSSGSCKAGSTSGCARAAPRETHGARPPRIRDRRTLGRRDARGDGARGALHGRAPPGRPAALLDGRRNGARPHRRDRLRGRHVRLRLSHARRTARPRHHAQRRVQHPQRGATRATNGRSIRHAAARCARRSRARLPLASVSLGRALGAHLLSYHNLAVLAALMADARAAIEADRWSEFRDGIVEAMRSMNGFARCCVRRVRRCSRLPPAGARRCARDDARHHGEPDRPACTRASTTRSTCRRSRRRSSRSANALGHFETHRDGACRRPSRSRISDAIQGQTWLRLTIIDGTFRVFEPSNRFAIGVGETIYNQTTHYATADFVPEHRRAAIFAHRRRALRTVRASAVPRPARSRRRFGTRR